MQSVDQCICVSEKLTCLCTSVYWTLIVALGCKALQLLDLACGGEQSITLTLLAVQPLVEIVA